MMSYPSQRSKGWLMSCNGSARSGNECLCLWATTFSLRTVLLRSSITCIVWTIMILVERTSCPPIPWSSISWTIIGIWKDYYYYYYYYYHFSYGAWSSAPHWLHSGGCGSSQCHVFDFYWLECLVSGECLFSFPALSKAESFDFLAFPFPFPHSLCGWSLLRVFCSSPPQFSP